MSKLTKMMAVVLCASAFIVALPIPSQAAETGCGGPALYKTTTNCFNGKTIIQRYYMQTCKYADGKSETRTWVETESYNGCKDPN